MLFWGLPVAYGVMAFMVLIEPSIIDAIDLRALVNAMAYTWQTETYRALLQVTSAHIAYSIYEIYVLTMISFVVAMVIWLGVVLKEPKLIKRYVLQHKGFNEQ